MMGPADIILAAAAAREILDRKYTALDTFYDSQVKSHKTAPTYPNYAAAQLSPIRYDDIGLSGSQAAVNHVAWMCDEIPNLVHAGKTDKAYRWLGFVQGVLWSYGLATINQLRDANGAIMPPEGSADAAKPSVYAFREQEIKADEAAGISRKVIYTLMQDALADLRKSAKPLNDTCELLESLTGKVLKVPRDYERVAATLQHAGILVAPKTDMKEWSDDHIAMAMLWADAVISGAHPPRRPLFLNKYAEVRPKKGR